MVARRPRDTPKARRKDHRLNGLQKSYTDVHSKEAKDNARGNKLRLRMNLLRIGLDGVPFLERSRSWILDYLNAMALAGRSLSRELGLVPGQPKSTEVETSTSQSMDID